MPKISEAYRGEDQTLEKIRAQYTHLLVEAGAIPDDQETKDKIWDLACEHVYVEFVKEGLMTTANEVLKHTTAAFKIIKTPFAGEIPEMKATVNGETATPICISDEPAPDGLKWSEIKRIPAIEELEQSQTTATPVFANGGVVKNHKSGFIGETGPEAIMPPRKINH